MNTKRHILPIIVFSQFCCTSLWFAGNAIINHLIDAFTLPSDALGHLSSAVQMGFILGTLLFALLTIADRFSPSKVFFTCAILGAIFNLFSLWAGNNLTSLIAFRFIIGLNLAGIYPVGMKIAADYFDKGLGKSLGYLVGALVLGTAFPHLLGAFNDSIDWHWVILVTSGLAVLGGLLIYFLVPDGPYRKPNTTLNINHSFGIFKDKAFKTAAIGYFGHMWELYAFWTFVPLLLATYFHTHGIDYQLSFWSFVIIASGGIACVWAGYLSVKFGSEAIASTFLTISTMCCLLSPLLFGISSPIVFIGFLLVWGMSVIADSPLFSTMVASSAPSHLKGTAITLVNCIGFSITVVSIQLFNWLNSLFLNPQYLFLVLSIGPLISLLQLFYQKREIA